MVYNLDNNPFLDIQWFLSFYDAVGFHQQTNVDFKLILLIQYVLTKSIIRQYQIPQMFGVINRLQSLLPTKKIDIFGQDSLMKSIVPYFTLLGVMGVGYYLAAERDLPFWSVFIIYGVIPLIDEIFSHDWRNPEKDQTKQLIKNNFIFEIPLYLTVVIDWYMFFAVMNKFATISITSQNYIFTVPKALGLAFIYWNLNAAQFAVAHEILHKNGWRKIVGTMHMIKTLNIHFTHQHLYGHHRRVATPQDPASAQKGINTYAFFVRSFFGSFKSVFQDDREKGKLFTNMAILSILASIIFTSIVYYVYGFQATILFLISAFGAQFYLQVINYIEHYGLRRKLLQNGEYENVTIKHSWNAPHRFSNYLFFKLQRHSDHHANSLKPYQSLLSMEESPQLPHGYIVMTIMAAFPWIWYRIMDPIVDSYNKNQESLNKIMQKAVKQTRKFIIWASLLSFTFALIISHII